MAVDKWAALEADPIDLVRIVIQISDEMKRGGNKPQSEHWMNRDLAFRELREAIWHRWQPSQEEYAGLPWSDEFIKTAWIKWRKADRDERQAILSRLNGAHSWKS